MNQFSQSKSVLFLKYVLLIQCFLFFEFDRNAIDTMTLIDWVIESLSFEDVS